MNENNQTPEAPLAKPEATVVDSPAVTPIPQTNETAKESLFEKIKSQTAKQASKVKIPKGTKVEDYYKLEFETEIKKKRGRPKKYKSITDFIDQNQTDAIPQIEQPQEEEIKSVYDAGGVDTITNVLEIAMVAGCQFKFKKKVEPFSSAERKALAQAEPANSTTKPSWVNYTITAVSLILIHFMQGQPINDKEKMENIMKANGFTQMPHRGDMDIPYVEAEPVN